jgi:NAD+ kinase
MTSKKLHFVFDKTNKANHQKKKLLRKFKNYSLHGADIIVVLGGDGFMLQTLKKLGKFNKPFYGMNMGTYGFLMNKFKTGKFLENLSKSKSITISALQMIVKTKNNTTKKGIAINEVSMFRQSKQAATIQSKKEKK